jgi:hypothetical protein
VGEVSQLVTNFFEGQKQMKAMFSGGLPGMPPGMGAMARRAAAKSGRGKKGKKKAVRSGDPRRAGEIARSAQGAGAQSGGAQGQQPGQAPPALGGGGLGAGGLGNLPEGLADQLANLPSGLNFPPPAQGNIPAAFRGDASKRRDKKK